MKSFECLNVKRFFNKNLGDFQRCAAFTLAEVLITLGIIGIVANMTIPTLMANIQKDQYVAALKKEYSVFNQVLKQMAADSGCPDDLKCVNGFTVGGSIESKNIALGNEVVTYLKIAKNCGTPAGNNCFPEYTGFNYDKDSVFYTGYNMNNVSDMYRFTTINGVSYLLERNDYNFTALTPTGSLSQVCGKLEIDVNGHKPPNRYGRDTFRFYITNGKGAALYPYGGKEYELIWWDGSTKLCNPTNTVGFYCAGRVIEEGWEMNY